MNLSIIESLIFFGGIQGLGLFAILFFTKRYRCLANRLLAGFILCISLIIVRNITEAQGLLVNLTYLSISTNVLIPLIGPLIFLYVKFLINVETKLARIDYCHFLPALIYFLIINTAALFGITNEIQIAQITWLRITASLLQFVIMLQLLTYLILSIRKVSSYIHWIQNKNTTAIIQSLFWLRRLLIFVLAISLLWLTLFAADIKLVGIEQPKLLLELFWLTFSLLIYWIGYYNLLKPDIFVANKSVVGSKMNNALTDEVLTQILNTLEAYMTTKKPYINSELTLKKLAIELQISSKALSKVINFGKNKSFIDYINFYRIEEIKRVLQDCNNHHLKIEIVAYEAGIRSSSTLNRLFKKYVNMTPSQYRAQFE